MNILSASPGHNPIKLFLKWPLINLTVNFFIYLLYQIKSIKVKDVRKFGDKERPTFFYRIDPSMQLSCFCILGPMYIQV
jgi:hypothetical protein